MNRLFVCCLIAYSTGSYAHEVHAPESTGSKLWNVCINLLKRKSRDPLIAGSDRMVPDVDQRMADIRTKITDVILQVNQADTTSTPLSAKVALRSFDEAFKYPALTNNSLSRLVPSELLGVGTTGMVVKAWDRDIQQWVAAKIAVDASKVVGDTIEREYRIGEECAQAFHAESPIPMTYGHYVNHGVAVHIMEYLPQGSLLKEWENALDSRVSNNFTPVRVVLAKLPLIGIQIQRLHAIGQLHGDIKPVNIGIGNDRVVLLDTGMSIKFDTESGKALEAPRGATEGYAAPELMALVNQKDKIKDASILSEKIDVYSFAKTVGLLLSEYMEILKRINSPSAKKTAIKIKDFTDHELSKAIATDPSARPTMQEFNTTLSAFIDTITKD